MGICLITYLKKKQPLHNYAINIRKFKKILFNYTQTINNSLINNCNTTYKFKNSAKLQTNRI